MCGREVPLSCSDAVRVACEGPDRRYWLNAVLDGDIDEFREAVRPFARLSAVGADLCPWPGSPAAAGRSPAEGFPRRQGGAGIRPDRAGRRRRQGGTRRGRSDARQGTAGRGQRRRERKSVVKGKGG